MFWTFFWKDKLCSFCELPAWWKCTQRPLLTKMRDFENSEASKTWKGKLYSFCKLPAWWKCTQTHLLTKVRDFERFEVAKTWKGKLCEKLLNLRTLQFFFLICKFNSRAKCFLKLFLKNVKYCRNSYSRKFHLKSIYILWCYFYFFFLIS